MGTQGELSTPMIHVLCGVCGMSGTFVRTATGERAWSDHMEIHDDPECFDAWTWEVNRLPFPHERFD